MKTILYNPIFINPQAYYVFPRLTRYLQPDNESTAEPANYIGTIEVKVIAYGDTTLKRTYTNTDSIDLSEFKNTWIRISLFTKVGSCVLGEWKIGNMESDLPYIDPEVLASLKAVVIVGNKTNNDSDRAIVKNLVDPDNPFVISNAAFKLNSGFGKYGMDFLEWKANSGMNFTSTKLTSTKPNLPGGWLTFRNVSGLISETKVKVSGAPKEFVFIGNNNGADDKFSVTINNGVYTIPEFTLSSASGFYINNNSGDWSNLVIEQIPSFEGAFVTDGIDDLIKSTKSATEMLDGSNEVTVVSMIHQIKTNDDTTRNNWFFTPVSYLENRVVKDKIGKTGIYGYTSTNVTNAQISDITPILGDKNDYTLYSKIEDGDRDYFTVEGFQNQGIWYVSSIAWYWTIIANKVLTTDQINQVIAYFNLDRTLKPDILCNTIKQGITNENHAEFGDKLIDYSGNGRDIQLNNIAWKGDSGIGKYSADFESFDWAVGISQKQHNKATMSLNSRLCNHTAIEVDEMKVNIIGNITELIYWYIANPDDTTRSEIRLTSGINTLPKSYAKDDGQTYNIGFAYISGDSEITIEQIPSHAGALCLDGVNDFGKVTGMPVYKDYTFIIDYERISYASSERWVAGVVSKSHVANQGAFILMTANTTVEPGKQAYSFGGVTSFNRDDFTRALVYQSKYKCGDVDLTVGEGVDSNTLWLGTFRDNDQRFFNGAIYSLMSFPYSMSEFLIERQLKKHKLGTLYPNMVEFRPVIKANDNYKIFYTAMLPLTGDIWERINIGDYVPVGRRIAIQMSFDNEAKKLVSAVSSQLGNITIVKNSNNIGYTIFGDVLKDKSPQKISITIEQDENYVLFNPVINSNYKYISLDFFLNNYQKKINIGDYIPKDAYLRANLYLNNNVDEPAEFTFNGVSIGYSRSITVDTAFNIGHIYNYDSPQEVNITIDEYIRYEDIVQPYPVLLRFNDESGKEVSWGGKFRVGSTITRIGSAADSNLLPNIYNIFGLLLNDNQVTSSKVIVEKTMVFKAKSAYIFDNNEPKCILSPSRLRIPNSSYKLLGYIPDISGHGNHGVIHNSAYAKGSGVNEDGSYQFDGVDDFVTIPTVTGGKQVLMKVNWQSIAGTAILYDQRTNGGFAIFNRDYDTNENKVPAYRARNIGGNTYIDGILNEYIYASQLQNITHNIVELYDPELNIGTLNPKIGSSYLNSNYAQMSLYDFMLFDNISTDDKIKELNEYVGIEAKVELPPYYWDAYGKTNLDEDKATIQQRGVAVGDYDLTNHNHAYEGMSGYNGYPVVFGANKTWENFSSVYSYTSDVTSTTIHITRVKNASTGLLFSYVKKDGALTNIREIPAFRVTVKGLEGNSKFGYRYLATEDATVETLVYLGNGTHELSKSFTPTEALLDLTRNAWVGIFITPMVEGEVVFDCDITIEVLPEYENGLVYDGVDDYSKNEKFPVLTDYTIIAKRLWINKDNPLNEQFIHKGAINTPISESAFMLEYEIANDTYYRSSSYGGYINIERSNRPERIVYQTSNSYNGTSITKGSGTDTTGIVIGGVTNNYWNGVFYKLMLYSKTLPLLQINYLKNLMEKDEIIDLNNKIFIQE